MKLKRPFIIGFVLILLTLRGTNALAATGEWTMFFTISTPYSSAPGGIAFNALSAGVRNGATDGYDNATDTTSLLEPDDPVQAYFTHGAVMRDNNGDEALEDWVCPNPEGGYSEYQCLLWRDFRALSKEKTWSLEVISPMNGATVSVNWNISGDPIDLAKVELTLADLSSSPPMPPVRLDRAMSYQYTNIFDSGKEYGLRRFEVRMKIRGIFIAPPSLPDATIETLYSKRFVGIGGSPSWSLTSGALPTGLSIEAQTGEITGTPTVAGSFTFTVNGTDPVSGYGSSREYTITVSSIPRIDVISLPDGIAGTEYSTPIGTTGGSAPVTWSLKGNLPEGISLNSGTGAISGKLLVPGVYDFTVVIRDANGATDSRDFRITVIEPGDEKPPDAIDDLRVLYVMDTAAVLMWSAPPDDSMTHTAALYDLRYLEGCSSEGELNWDLALQASGEPRPQEGALHTYTLTGLKKETEYCIGIQALDATGHKSSISNIVRLPLTGSGTGFISAANPNPFLLRKGYNFISFPLVPLPDRSDPLLGPIVGEPVSLYRWYSAFPGISPPQYYTEDMIVPGAGYFLYSQADGVPLSVNGLELVADVYPVSLQNGWNMIGNPYTKAILLKDVQVKDALTGDTRSYMEGVTGGWIGNTLYQLNAGNYDFFSFNDDPPAVLEPWVGYWIYVGREKGLEILFRKP